jgi:hypothetical protein
MPLLVYQKGVGRIPVPELTLREIEPLVDELLARHEHLFPELTVETVFGIVAKVRLSLATSRAGPRT